MNREYKQGDVVFWRYKEDYAKSLHNDRYWCKSKLAIFHDVKGGGLLIPIGRTVAAILLFLSQMTQKLQ